MTSTTRPVSAVRVPVLVLIGLTGVHLAGQLAGWGLVSDVTQVLLMPAVAGVLWAATAAPRPRLVRLVLLALFFSWLGDTLPRLVEDGFVLMVGGFLLAQIAYAAAFWPWRAQASATTRPWLVAVAALAVLALLLVCRAEAGLLLVPVGGYAVALVAMVLLADGVSRLSGWGAVVFLVSDAMIGLGAFTELDPPAAGFWVMLTYVAGQTLITLGVAERAGRPVLDPLPR